MRSTASNTRKALTILAIAAAGVVAAAFTTSLIYRGVVTGPLFAHADDVPSVMNPAPSPQYAAAVERARTLVRAALAAQNLPGLSVAVAAGSTVVWAEGFGWRDVGTRTRVTPDTRFNIGTAASAVAGSVAPLGLAHTGADAADEWSPEAIGEEGEDFPPFALLRHAVFQPLGLMAADYPLPGERATFYVPRTGDDPRSGRRLMPMRNLACCAHGMAFSSTPSDLVRVGAATNAGSVDGVLAGGMVTSLLAAPGGDIVVAVSSNMAHADTAVLARQVSDAFGAR
jgi:CubicO group peptidase (beta-lactamase class C family)